MNRTCKKCLIEKDITNFHKSGYKSDGMIKYKYTCRLCRTSEEKSYKKLYRDSHKDEIRSYNRKYESNRKKIDIVFSMKRRIRSLICQSFKSTGNRKSNKTESILGCSISNFLKHIESQFVYGMNWENRQLWHIDHIKPIMTATSEEDVIKLNHYTNLRPLWASDNLDKRSSDRILWEKN